MPSRGYNLQIDNQNSRPFVSLTSPQSGQIYAVDEKSIISGVARDNDGDITRVDVEVFDVSNGFINVFTGAVTEIESNGYWEMEWDSRILTHNMQYLIKARSYDGYEYSDWMEVQVVADNLQMQTIIDPHLTQLTGKRRLLYFANSTQRHKILAQRQRLIY